ncbi:MAG: hypothetical protein P4L74_02240 [Candidatus Doudnabacteria bacterium]|nr:hypothetical protein [Candidatus Doudnabacteria bacterium]
MSEKNGRKISHELFDGPPQELSPERRLRQNSADLYKKFKLSILPVLTKELQSGRILPENRPVIMLKVKELQDVRDLMSVALGKLEDKSEFIQKLLEIDEAVKYYNSVLSSK